MSNSLDHSVEVLKDNLFLFVNVNFTKSFLRVIGVSGLIQLLKEGRLRRACGPARISSSPFNVLLTLPNLT